MVGETVAKIIDGHFIGLLESLNLNIRLALKNSQMGSRRSSAKGSSVEFSDYSSICQGMISDV